jgi:hypothetical protein
MNCNDRISCLLHFCKEGAGMSKMATAGKRLPEFSYRFATLYERDFRDFDAFRDVISEIVADDRNDYPNNLQRKIAEREGQKLLAFLDTLRDECPAVSIPYCRILTGSEAEAVAADFWRVWAYNPNALWYPLDGEWRPDAPCMYVMDWIVKPYWDAILSLLCPEGERVLTCHADHFACLDSWREAHFVAEIDRDYVNMDGSEVAYTDREFRNMLYVCHENTLSFAGDWVPAVQAVLANERERWNKYTWE